MNDEWGIVSGCCLPVVEFILIDWVEWELILPEDTPTEADHELCTLDEAPDGTYFWEIPNEDDPDGPPVRHMSRCLPEEGEYTIQYLNCNEDGLITSITTTECTSGICDDETGTCVIPACMDEDGGENPNVQGEVVAILPTGAVQSNTDMCSSDVNHVLEYFCDGINIESSWLDCNPDEECFEGACRPLSEDPSNCTDSDGGRNENVAGEATYVTSDGISHTGLDHCNTDQTAVFEYYCIDNNYRIEHIRCESGYCSDGACLSAIECIDSDEGIEINTFGWVTVTFSDGTEIERMDSCSFDSTGVIEWYCDDDGTTSQSTWRTCDSGYCEGGECRPESENPTSCTDHDGGIDPNTASSVEVVNITGETSIYEDGCSHTHRSVLEYYCVDNTYQMSMIDCEPDEVCMGGGCHTLDCTCRTIIPPDTEEPQPRTTVGILDGECTEHTDYCDFDEDGEKKLFKLGCGESNQIVVESIESCPEGTACVNGVCR